MTFAFEALQLYLTFHILSRFFGLSKDLQKLRRRYILFLPVVELLSIVRFTLYLQDGLMTVTDRPVPQRNISFQDTRDYAVATLCTLGISLVGDAFLVCFSPWNLEIGCLLPVLLRHGERQSSGAIPAFSNGSQVLPMCLI
jgi:hypothetical protein